MKETHQFEKAFGPGVSFAGKPLFIVGLILLFYSTIGLILLLLGAFLGFTNTCTTIDFEKRKVKHSNNLFGFIKTGSWIDINDSMKTAICKSKHIYRTNSQSNKTADVETESTLICLFNSEGKKIMPLKKIVSIENQDTELTELNGKLGLSVLQ